jgi:hypothetical protein
MALPKAETGVVEMLALIEAEDARDAALKQMATVEPEKGSSEGINKAIVAIAEAQGAMAMVAGDTGNGLDDYTIDFTSYPIITLNNEVFSSDEHKSFGTVFECVFMAKRYQYLFKGDLGRDKEPELIYSDDGITSNKEPHLPIAHYIEDWKSRGIPYDRKVYEMVTVQMIDSPHAEEICQLQVSPGSAGKLGGYLMKLKLKGKKSDEVVTRVSVGSKVGSGVKAFTPFAFDFVK